MTVDIEAIERYISAANPHLSYADVKSVASESVGMIMAEGASVKCSKDGTEIRYHAGYTASVVPVGTSFSWSVTSTSGQRLGTGVSDFEEDAHLATEALIEAALAEGR